jgi:hypothetical protein
MATDAKKKILGGKNAAGQPANTATFWLQSKSAMKKFIANGLAILGICSPIFGVIILGLDTPQDNPVALRETWDRAELNPLRAEYENIISTRIWPLKYGDVTNIFGPKLDAKPNHYALPIFVPVMQGMSGLAPKNDKRHMDFYALGDVGYFQVYYNWDGDTIGIAAFYLRTDDKFVPLQSTNDFARRLDWDKAGFASLKRWFDQRLPKLTDLGVVEVSSNAPSRVALDNSKTCIITTQILTRPEMTNDWFSMELTLDSTNAAEREQSRNYISVSQPGKSISFTMDGRFFRLTPKLKKF